MFNFDQVDLEITRVGQVGVVLGDIRPSQKIMGWFVRCATTHTPPPALVGDANVGQDPVDGKQGDTTDETAHCHERYLGVWRDWTLDHQVPVVCEYNPKQGAQGNMESASLQ